MQKKLSKSRRKPQRNKYHLLLVVTSIVLSIIVAGVAIVTAQQRLKENAITRLQQISNHDSGSTYDEVVDTIQAKMPEYEIIFVFDQDGQKLIEYTLNQRHGVSLPDEALKLLSRFRGLTHAHNHPFVDSGPSDGDLGMLRTTGLDKAVDELVIIGKKHTYHLNHANQAWPTYNEVMQYMFYLYNVYGSFGDAGLMESAIVDGEERIYFTNLCLQKFADDLGYTFQVRETS